MFNGFDFFISILRLIIKLLGLGLKVAIVTAAAYGEGNYCSFPNMFSIRVLAI